MLAQHSIRVYYDGMIIGEYFADLLVDNAIIIGIKAANAISIEHEASFSIILKPLNLRWGLL